MLAVALQSCFKKTLSPVDILKLIGWLDKICDQIVLPTEDQWPGNTSLPQSLFPKGTGPAQSMVTEMEELGAQSIWKR